MRIPDATYAATLDADSLMTWDYALRLVPVMERPGGERIAIAQTPYTAGHRQVDGAGRGEVT